MDKAEQFYVVAVKAGATRLFSEFKQLLISQALSVYETSEKRKGTQLYTLVSVYPCSQWVCDNWCSSKRMIVLENTIVSKDGSSSYEKRFYLTNVVNDDAAYFAKGIRGHWSIENKLHWVKDVQFNEDNSLIKNKNTASIYSIFIAWVLNITRYLGYSKWTDWLARFCNRIDRMVQIFLELGKSEHIHQAHYRRQQPSHSFTQSA